MATLGMPWVGIVAILLVVVIGCFVAGAIDAWWEQRKWDKNKGG